MPALARVILLLLVVAAGPGARAQPLAISGRAAVTDGDTLVVSNVRVRLHGIDAPEAAQTCRRPDGRSWACGLAAAARLQSLVRGGPEVRCAGREYDRYRRLIAICRVGESPTSLNETMVAEGLAWAFVRYSRDYTALEARARAARLGVFSGVAEPPWEFREARWLAAGNTAPRSACPIKGNISRRGERIYHMPWDRFYGRTQIDTRRGERWFCDEGEAERAGWRRARL